VNNHPAKDALVVRTLEDDSSVHMHSRKNNTYVTLIWYLTYVAVHAFKIKILEDWNDDLKHKKSAVFRDLASRLETEVGV